MAFHRPQPVRGKCGRFPVPEVEREAGDGIAAHRVSVPVPFGNPPCVFLTRPLPEKNEWEN
jgi:hypothetical protein